MYIIGPTYKDDHFYRTFEFFFNTINKISFIFI